MINQLTGGCIFETIFLCFFFVHFLERCRRLFIFLLCFYVYYLFFRVSLFMLSNGFFCRHQRACHYKTELSSIFRKKVDSFWRRYENFAIVVYLNVAKNEEIKHNKILRIQPKKTGVDLSLIISLINDQNSKYMLRVVIDWQIFAMNPCLPFSIWVSKTITTKILSFLVFYRNKPLCQFWAKSKNKNAKNLYVTIWNCRPTNQQKIIFSNRPNSDLGPTKIWTFATPYCIWLVAVIDKNDVEKFLLRLLLLTLNDHFTCNG